MIYCQGGLVLLPEKYDRMILTIETRSCFLSPLFLEKLFISIKKVLIILLASFYFFSFIIKK